MLTVRLRLLFPYAEWVSLSLSLGLSVSQSQTPYYCLSVRAFITLSMFSGGV